MTEFLAFQSHFTHIVHHFKFTFTNSFIARSQDNTQATTLAHAQVPQAKVSAAHLSQTLIFISVLDTNSINSTFVFSGNISILFSIAFQYFSIFKSNNFVLRKYITA